MTKSELVGAAAEKGVSLSAYDQKRLKKALDNGRVIEEIASKYSLVKKEKSKDELKVEAIKKIIAEIRYINSVLRDCGPTAEECIEAQRLGERRTELLNELNSGELTDRVFGWHGAVFKENGYTIHSGRLFKSY